MSAKAYLKTVGSEAYVQFTAFVAYDAINEGCVCTCEDFMEGVGCIGHRSKQDTPSFSLRANLASLICTSHHA